MANNDYGYSRDTISQMREISNRDSARVNQKPIEIYLQVSRANQFSGSIKCTSILDVKEKISKWCCIATNHQQLRFGIRALQNENTIADDDL